MVLLDTNVMSEPMRAAPSAEVLAWMDDLPARQLFVPVVTEAEVRTGIDVLLDGACRRVLVDAAERTLLERPLAIALPLALHRARISACWRISRVICAVGNPHALPMYARTQPHSVRTSRGLDGSGTAYSNTEMSLKGSVLKG